MRNLLVILGLCLLTQLVSGQEKALPPAHLELEPIPVTNTPGLHSFAFASSGSNWMFVGGRINGLHGLNVNGGFPVQYANDNIVVVDTTTWMTYATSLSTLPFTVADPLRSTNMEYHQEGDYLYMIGGYGMDSINEFNATFPVLTAIHVDSMMDAVINGQPIQPHIRQLTDSALMACGAELEKLGDYYYLIGGHDFAGRYDDDSPSFLFLQTYTNGIARFQIVDDGVNLSIANYSNDVDSAHFHRRDLSTNPVVNADGSFGIGVYGGVFRRDYNLPFLNPIYIAEDGSKTVRTDVDQLYNQYTTAIVPFYDSVAQKMHTVFLGGTSLYYFNDTTQQVTIDSLVPFVDDISALTVFPDGSIEEYLLPVEMPGLLGTNAKFILKEDVPHYDNHVIKIRELTGRTHVGYMYGGIRAEEANGGNSSANDTIYRVYLTPDYSLSSDALPEEVLNIELYPNPASSEVTIYLQTTTQENVVIRIFDLEGREVMTQHVNTDGTGMLRQRLNVAELAEGLYICKMQIGGTNLSRKFAIKQ